MSELFIADTTYTLNGSITSSATSIAVTAVSGSLGTAPSSMANNQFRARIDNEILLVTATDSTGLTWTVTRGIEGTTAASHATAAVVALVLTPAALAQARVESGALFPMTPPPVTGWTQVNLPISSGGTTVAANFSNGYPEIVANINGASVRITMLAVAAPSTPYTCDGSVLFTPNLQTGFKSTGLAFYDSVSGKFYLFAILVGINGPYASSSLAVYYYTNTTTFNSAPMGASAVDMAFCKYLRLKNDGTNLTFHLSADGTNWAQQFTTPIASSINPTHVGFFLDAEQTGQTTTRLVHWKLG